ncbi:MAG TPA: hypothetical protein VIL86_17760 [Tepidisphaeraceae bacterium]
MRNMMWIVAVMMTAAAGWAQTTQPTTKPADKFDSAKSRTDQMLKRPGDVAKPLQPGESGAVDQTSGAGAVSPGAPTVKLMREGDYIRDRVGRLTRGADGQQWEFTFDADGKAMQDPPMVLIPNLMLLGMENAVTGNQRDLRFRVTGMVTEYRGRNYLLLEKVVVVPDVTQPLK